jgi:hypothetical protein
MVLKKREYLAADLREIVRSVKRPSGLLRFGSERRNPFKIGVLQEPCPKTHKVPT